MSARFTTSWDDGHPLDLRLADLLATHGFRGTFYVPGRNIEGRPVMSGSELRRLAEGFEIGGHTMDHVRLGSLSPDEVRRQIVDNKRALEDTLGRSVTSFCYPGGTHDASVRSVVRDAGYRYARTTTDLLLATEWDPLRAPTTIQFYPHRAGIYVRNFLRRGLSSSRARALAIARRSRSLEELLRLLLDSLPASPAVFHLWGHSWEIEANGLWASLTRFLRLASELIDRSHRIENRSLVGGLARQADPPQ